MNLEGRKAGMLLAHAQFKLFGGKYTFGKKIFIRSLLQKVITKRDDVRKNKE